MLQNYTIYTISSFNSHFVDGILTMLLSVCKNTKCLTDVSIGVALFYMIRNNQQGGNDFSNMTAPIDCKNKLFLMVCFLTDKDCLNGFQKSFSTSNWQIWAVDFFMSTFFNLSIFIFILVSKIFLLSPDIKDFSFGPLKSLIA